MRLLMLKLGLYTVINVLRKETAVRSILAVVTVIVTLGLFFVMHMKINIGYKILTVIGVIVSVIVLFKFADVWQKRCPNCNALSSLVHVKRQEVSRKSGRENVARQDVIEGEIEGTLHRTEQAEVTYVNYRDTHRCSKCNREVTFDAQEKFEKSSSLVP